ncbi:hypothetical protein PIROE2DRAFT_20870 [Piromyces sp. E2]|nr:hypothetical protein PIROE2DRAFT_20870 [Piromyces sp. E2]|eukprot:OUM62036.1 hypothetical protein PIROE2DRAFT_20870 [Piromyces sp. E2]
MDFPKYKNIIFEHKNVNINITECDDDDILLYMDDKNTIPACQQPRCNCKNYSSNNYTCKKGNNTNNINNEKFNICKCNSGYSGDTCDPLLELILKSTMKKKINEKDDKNISSKYLFDNSTYSNSSVRSANLTNILNAFENVNITETENDDQKNFINSFLSNNELDNQNRKDSMDNLSMSSNYKNIRNYVKHIEWKKELVGNEFIFTCKYGNTELFLTTIEDVLVVSLIFKLRKIFKFSLILKEMYVLTLTVYLWVFIGPLVDLTSQLALENFPVIKIYFCNIALIICYELMFISFYLDKFYCLITKNGNNRSKYVKFFNNQKCEEHSSYTCGCTTKQKISITNEDKILINNYFIIINDILKFKNVFTGKIELLKSTTNV